MRFMVVAALATLGGCAAREVTPTFAMYSETERALLVQVTSDKGDKDYCESFWNMFRKSSSQVCGTKHRRQDHWVRVYLDGRTGGIEADGSVDQPDLEQTCVVDGADVRCDEQRASTNQDGVAVTRRSSTPEVSSTAADGRTATFVRTDRELGPRIATVETTGGPPLEVRDASFLGDRVVAAVSPGGGYVMVRAETGCDVVEIETRLVKHEVTCGEFVGDVGYVIPGVKAELVRLSDRKRAQLGDVRKLDTVDAGTLLGRGPHQLVVIRRSDAAVVVAPVGTLGNRIVVSDRAIAALDTSGHRAVIFDRESMLMHSVEVEANVRSVAGVVGDTVFLGVRKDGKREPTVLAISATSGHRETLSLQRR